MKSKYKVGEPVFVEDGQRPKFYGVISGTNAANSATYEVTDDKNLTWIVHWCYLRDSDKASQ